jgi:Mor family transcriptional regulator
MTKKLRGTRIHQNVLEEILEMRKKGAFYATIARHFDMSAYKVREVLRGVTDLSSRGWSEVARKNAAIRLDQMICMRCSGKTLAQIGFRFKVSKARVHQLLKDVPHIPKRGWTLRAAKLKGMMIDGASTSALEEATGFTRDYIQKKARKRGISLMGSFARGWTSPQLREAMRHFYQVAGRVPRFVDFIKAVPGKTPTSSTFVRRFGSWNKAINDVFGRERGRHFLG